MKNTNETNGHREFSLTFADGFARFELPITEFEVVERESKGTKTGVLARKFSESLTAANLADGLGFSIINEAGEVEIGKKVSFLLETTSPRTLAAKAEAKLFRNFAANFKKYTGFTKTKNPIPESKRLHLADVIDWLDGRRKVDGYDFQALPEETQRKILDTIEKMREKASKPKVESSLQILRNLMADEAAFAVLSPENQQEIRARIAQADKAAAAAAAAKQQAE
jgi:hypothetical protein